MAARQPQGAMRENAGQGACCYAFLEVRDAQEVYTAGGNTALSDSLAFRPLDGGFFLLDCHNKRYHAQSRAWLLHTVVEIVSSALERQDRCMSCEASSMHEWPSKLLD
eukprot:1140250-Pelagomonas_calceolata.AAC.12